MELNPGILWVTAVDVYQWTACTKASSIQQALVHTSRGQLTHDNLGTMERKLQVLWIGAACGCDVWVRCVHALRAHVC